MSSTAKEFVVKDWQKRVLSECSELGDRISRLEKFLKSYASEEGRNDPVQGLSYLDLQLSAMRLYSYMLNRRIDLFE